MNPAGSWTATVMVGSRLFHGPVLGSVSPGASWHAAQTGNRLMTPS